MPSSAEVRRRAVAPHAAGLADRQPGLPREHDVGRRADAADDESPRPRASRAAPRARTRSTRSPAPANASTSTPPTTSTPCSSSTRAEEAPRGGAEVALQRLLLEHDDRHAACPGRSATPRPRSRCRSRRRRRRARRPRRRGAARRRCRARAGSGCRRAGRRRAAAAAPSAPVASSAVSNETSSLVASVAAGASGSSAITAVRVSSSTSLAAHQSACDGRARPRDRVAAQVALGDRRAVVGRVELAPDEQDRARAPCSRSVGRRSPMRSRRR